MSITNPSLEAYSLISTNPGTVANSSSGGGFFEFARQVISEGGIVVGAAMDEKGKLILSKASAETDLPNLMRSKYVQAEVGSIFKEIKEVLITGTKVLFCSVPCYCNALYEYLQNDCDNLIIVDVICHGIPSPLLWEKYIKYRGFQDVQRVNFRDKRNGWSNYGISIVSGEAEYFCDRRDDPYMKLFLNNISLRPSCYNCQFKGQYRRADITLGDYWGVIDYENKGISLCIINTEKGKRFFESVSSELVTQKVDAEKALSHNTSFYKSVGLPLQRKKLFEDLEDGKEVFSSIEVYLKHSLYDKILKGFRRLRRKIGNSNSLYVPYVHKEINSLKQNCCGCGLCEQICPKDAIKMQKDKEGFMYPVTNQKLCINCGQCVKYCFNRSILRQDIREIQYD